MRHRRQNAVVGLLIIVIMLQVLGFYRHKLYAEGLYSASDRRMSEERVAESLQAIDRVVSRSFAVEGALLFLLVYSVLLLGRANERDGSGPASTAVQ